MGGLSLEVYETPYPMSYTIKHDNEKRTVFGSFFYKKSDSFLFFLLICYEVYHVFVISSVQM